MWSLQWQALYHSGIYEHPPIRLFVSWVGGCRVWSGLFTGGGSCWKSVIPKYNDTTSVTPKKTGYRSKIKHFPSNRRTIIRHMGE